MVFDGTNDKVDLAAGAGAHLRDDKNVKGTIEVQFLSADLSADRTLVGFGDASADEYLNLFTDANDKLAIEATDAGTAEFAATTDNTISTDVSYDVALVQNGTEPKIYVDGIDQDLTFSVSTDKTSWFSQLAGLDSGGIGFTNYLTLGADGEWFEGQIYRVRLWNVDLSEDEIREFMYTGVPFKYQGGAMTELMPNVVE